MYNFSINVYATKYNFSIIFLIALLKA